MSKGLKIFKYASVAAGILILGDILIFLVIPYGLLDGNKELSSKDAAVVLYSGNPRENSSLNRESIRRLNYAIKLYRAGKADNLLFSGGFRSDLLKINGSRLMALNAEKMGVPEENIFSEIKSYDTVTNIREALIIAEKEGWSDISVVGSKFHLIRTKYLVGRMIDNERLKVTLDFWPYSYFASMPETGRFEFIRDFNYNLASFALSLLFPEDLYRSYVKWVRLNDCGKLN